MTTEATAAAIAADMAVRRTRTEGGQLCVYDPLHVLARKNGWVPAGRWVLGFRLELEGVTRLLCETPGCGRRVEWAKRRWQRTNGKPAGVPWFIDGDPGNLDARNIALVCASCAMRGHMQGRSNHGDDGRFRSPSAP